MTQLRCTDKEGNERIYLLKCEYDSIRGEFTYRVYSDPLPSSGEFFELSVKEVKGELQVTAMYNHNEPEYKGKGIPDSLLMHVAAQSGKRVRSSPSWAPGGVYRTPDATKVWDRLVSKKLASYSEQDDVYQTS